MFVGTSNGSVSVQVDGAYRPVPDQLRHNLGLLDGDEDFAFLMFYVPNVAGWPDGPGFNEADWDGEFIQSAGSAEAMTIEVRRREADGEYHQYAIGRRDADPMAAPIEVRFAENTLTVPPSEVFTADDAAPIYYRYFQSHTVPDDVVLRELDLT